MEREKTLDKLNKKHKLNISFKIDNELKGLKLIMILAKRLR